LFRIKKEARRCKKDFEKIRFKMMFKTTPDSMDALKTCREIPFWQEVPDCHPYVRILLHLNAGYESCSVQSK
jgi:hypothetical protein